MSDRPQLLYCQDILESGAAIQSYVQGMTFDAFIQERMRYTAVIRELKSSVRQWASYRRS